MSLPLAGLRVLDLTRALAGPYCTMILADLGAEVIKAEPIQGGDMTRQWGPYHGGIGVFYLSINRNKQSLKLAHMIQSAALYKTRASNRGIKKANFLVLSKNNRPAILLECAFLTNSSDRYRALDPAYRQRIAEAIAMGIIKFRQSD